MRQFAGFWRLLALQSRCSWRLLLLCLLGLACGVVAVASGVRELYAGVEERAIYAATLGASAASMALNGRGYDLEHLGGITAYEVGFFGQLAFPVIGVIMAVRLTRAQEEQGLLELVTATRAHRVTTLLAAAAAILMSWVCFIFLTSVGLIALGYPGIGGLRYSISMAVFGLCWSGIGLLAAQTARTSRGATGIGLVLVLAGYLVRAVVDSRASSVTWLSPMSWVVEVRAWGQWDMRPMLALTALAVAAGLSGVLLGAMRDLGAGLFQVRPGPESARLISHPWALALRLNAGSALGWMLGAVAWAGTLGLLTREFTAAVSANPGLAAITGGAIENFASQMALLIGACCASAAGLVVALRFGREEADGRLGLALAGRLARWRWWSGWHLVAMVISATVLLAAATTLGIAQWCALEDQTAFPRALICWLQLLPAVWAMVSVGAALVGVWPRCRAAAWLLPAWAFIVGLLAEILRLPAWARNLSAVELVGRVPAENANAHGVFGLLLSVVAAILLGGLRFTRRDLLRG